MVAEDALEEVAVAAHEGDDFGVFADVPAELRKLVLLGLDPRDLLDEFDHGRVEGLPLHHEGRGLQKLNGPQHDGHELREPDAEVAHVQSFLEFFEFGVAVVELDEVEEVAKLGEHLVVPEEVEHVLVGHAQLLLLLLLLVFHDEVVEEDLVELVEMLLQGNLDPLLRRFLVLSQVKFLLVGLLDDRPELFETEAA